MCSILGPVLFTLFINDLPDCVESTCKIFADDTKLYNTTQNKDIIQDDIRKLQEWSEKWNLYFNASKCKVMHMGRNNPCHKYKMKVGDDYVDIAECEEEKDLGVTFDPLLKFDRHVQNIIAKANQMIGVIKRTFTFLDKDSFLKLYKAFIRPHLEYANTIWSPKLRRQSSAIEKVQRRALKLLKNMKDLSYEERLKTLKLPTLKCRRIRGDLIQAYKIFTGVDDVDNFFPTQPITANKTRHNLNKIFMHHCSSNIRKNTFVNRVAPIWNPLPDHIKSAPNIIITFKNLIDQQRIVTENLYNYDM